MKLDDQIIRGTASLVFGRAYSNWYEIINPTLLKFAYELEEYINSDRGKKKKFEFPYSTLTNEDLNDFVKELEKGAPRTALLCFEALILGRLKDMKEAKEIEE